MVATFEEVVVKEAVPAKDAVIKKIMVMKVNQDTKKVFDDAYLLSNFNWIFYPALLIILEWIFIQFDVLNESSHVCTYYYHGGCDDDSGLATLVVPFLITFILMAPALWASLIRRRMKHLLLKEAGWDGISEYRLELKE